ncbi:GtrA family protein [Patescibacteria group bacterium]|nr:GtrA family protein [Patescibacteria group bacterium]
MLKKIIIFITNFSYNVLQKIGINIAKDWWEQFIRFFIVGGFSTIVDFALLFSLTEWAKLWYLLSATVGFSGGAITNYSLNKNWTFQNKDKRIARQFTVFFIVALVGLAINNTILYLGVEVFNLWYMLAKVIAAAVTLIWSFIGHKYITFRPQNTPAL